MTATLSSAPPQAGPDGARPPRRWGRTAVIVVVAVLAVVGAVWGLVQLSGGAGRSETTVDRATDPDGLRAFVLLLEAFGSEVVVGSVSAFDRPDLDVDVVLVVPGVDPTADEWAAVDRWLEETRGLVVDATGVDIAVGPVAAGRREAALSRGESCSVTALADVDELVVAGDDVLVDVLPGEVACFAGTRIATSGGAYLTVSPPRAGAPGTWVSMGGVSPFTNRLLDQADNPVLATSLFAPEPGTTVLLLRGVGGLPTGTGIDEVGSGSGQGGVGGDPGGDDGDDGDPGDDPEPPDEDTLADLVPVGVRYGLLQLLVAGVLYAWWRGRRVGAPVAEPLPVDIAGSELVAAVGDLLARRGSVPDAAATLRADARRVLAGRLGLPGDADGGTVVEAVARRTGRSPDEVGNALTGSPVDDIDELVALAARLDALREEVFHGVRA